MNFEPCVVMLNFLAPNIDVLPIGAGHSDYEVCSYPGLSPSRKVEENNTEGPTCKREGLTLDTATDAAADRARWKSFLDNDGASPQEQRSVIAQKSILVKLHGSGADPLPAIQEEVHQTSIFLQAVRPWKKLLCFLFPDRP
ncbi:hypothetical protein Bbelb_166350 [Branchiostoma belcheri]|nr:hypothetical protein Bbelb_166350 [Branchiostoma belcheri]